MLGRCWEETDVRGGGVWLKNPRGPEGWEEDAR